MGTKEFGDIVDELRRRYRQGVKKILKKKKQEIWLAICQDLFDQYGEKFGYQDIHLFKSDLKKCQLNLLKAEKEKRW
jgi:hypothetical protein